MRSRKLQALEFIRSYFRRFGVSPSRSEIAAQLGVSQQRVRDLIDQLVKDGEITRTGAKRRNLRLARRSDELSHAEMLLRLAEAGYLIFDGEHMILPADHPLAKTALPRPADLDYDPELG